MSLIYLDATIFIQWLQNQPSEETERTRQLISEIEIGNFQVVLSAILFAEVFPHHKNNKLSFAKFENLCAQFELRALDARIARKAVEYREKFNLKAPDAIHLATAVLYKAEYFCTTDKKLLKRNDNFSEIDIVEAPPLRGE